MSDYEAAQRRRDVVVGIFVIVGLGALGWMILKFNDLPAAVTRMRSFDVYVQFPTAPGVMKDTPVRFCGYQVGRVTTVMAPQIRKDHRTGQEYHQALCILSVNRRYTDIPSNVEVKLMTRGLGSSYLELKVDPSKLPAPPLDPNDPSTCYLKDGMSLQGSTGMTSEFFPEESQQKLDVLIEAISKFATEANEILGENRESVKKTIEALPTAVDEAITTMKEARETLKKYGELAETGRGTLKNADAKVERLVASMVATSEEVGKSVAQLRMTLEKINNGQGSAGRLINDGRLYESLLEDTTQLSLLLKDLKELVDKVSEKGLRSIY